MVYPMSPSPTTIPMILFILFISSTLHVKVCMSWKADALGTRAIQLGQRRHIRHPRPIHVLFHEQEEIDEPSSVLRAQGLIPLEPVPIVGHRSKRPPLGFMEPLGTLCSILRHMEPPYVFYVRCFTGLARPVPDRIRQSRNLHLVSGPRDIMLPQRANPCRQRTSQDRCYTGCIE